MTNTELVPLSPTLAAAGFRIFLCGGDGEDETECAACSRRFAYGDPVCWTDDGLYHDSAEAYCRRCAFAESLRQFAEPYLTFWSRQWRKPVRYCRRTLKTYYRPDRASRLHFHRSA